MAEYSPLITRLITELGRLPGIGKKSAQRLAFHVLEMPLERAQSLADTILEARKQIHFCPVCCNLTDLPLCEVCSAGEAGKREGNTLCVVESPRDVAAMERIHEYKGLYHVLHGAISPMRDVGPESLKLRELLTRLQEHPEIEELIIATNPTVEGEATALYIARLLKSSGIRCTRIAHGLPMGGDIEYTDEVTLARALQGRQEI